MEIYCEFSTWQSGKLIAIIKGVSAVVLSHLLATNVLKKKQSLLNSSQINDSFSSHRLEKITHTNSGKYECVFLTDPEVKQTIEVRSK